MNKKNSRLPMVLGVLIVVAYLYNGPYRNWQENKSSVINFLSEVRADEVDEVRINKQGKEIVLVKQGSRWKVDGTKDFYLKGEVASDLDTGLNEAISGEFELISTSPERKEEFEVGDEGALIALLKSGETLSDFVLGKSVSIISGSYLSRGDVDETYLVKSDLGKYFLRSDWYDKVIFDIDENKVTKIRFQYPDREFTLELKDGKWKGVLPYLFNVDQDKIKDILIKFVKLSAENIPVQTFEGTGLEKHSIIVQMTGDSVDSTIMIGDESGSGEYYAKNSVFDNIYLISSSIKELLDTTIWGLK